MNSQMSFIYPSIQSFTYSFNRATDPSRKKIIPLPKKWPSIF